MCGISGCLLARGVVDKSILQGSISAMRHRGPDEDGTFTEGRFGLGHARLSIIDISTGQQPMTSADGRYVVVFNGEIYNFAELRRDCVQRGYPFRTRSDTEVILALYADIGADCLQAMRGMFAFAIYDRRNASLFLARDRLGVKPLLYADTPDGFFFASEMPALLALAPTLRDELDPFALNEYFVRQYITAPRTAYRRVRKLEPGTWLVRHAHRPATDPQRYWFPERVAPFTGTRAEAAEELRRHFTEATRIRLISERPVGALLSGGVDSSITVAVMSRLLERPVKTYAAGFSEKQWDEREHARSVARHCATEHEELQVEFDCHLPDQIPAMLRPFGEPYADNSLIPTFFIARLARRGVTVILTGDGADEMWGGYKRHYHAARLLFLNRFHLRTPWLAARRLGAKLARVRRPTGGGFPRNHLDRVLLAGQTSPIYLTTRFSTDECRELLRWEALHTASQEQVLASRWPVNSEWDPITQFLFYELKTFLADDVLPKVDIATMLNSMEARSPFLDQRVVEFTLSLPRRFKMTRSGEGKSLLKQAFADMVPPGLFARPKMGFTPPMATWLRTLLRDWCADQISSDTARRVFHQPALWRRFEQHQAGANHARVLWMCAVFCEWANRNQVAV